METLSSVITLSDNRFYLFLFSPYFFVFVHNSIIFIYCTYNFIWQISSDFNTQLDLSRFFDWFHCWYVYVSNSFLYSIEVPIESTAWEMWFGFLSDRPPLFRCYFLLFFHFEYAFDEYQHFDELYLFAVWFEWFFIEFLCVLRKNSEQRTVFFEECEFAWCEVWW